MTAIAVTSVQAAEPQTSGVVPDSAIEKALTGKKTRGISIRDTSAEKAADSGESRPAIDLNIPFASNSSELRPEAIAQLRQLESALKSPALLRDRFLIAGHTDAKGDAGYNRDLSLRRAASVKDFLVGSGVDPQRLQSTGEGENHLLTPDAPENPANRRVEISNLGVPR